MALPETLQTSLKQKGIPNLMVERWDGMVENEKGFYLEVALKVYQQVLDPDQVNLNSLEEIYNDQHRVIFGQVTHYMGQEYTISLIAELIARISSVVSVGKQFSSDGEMVMMTAKMISEDELMKKISIGEFKYILKKGVSGAYGELYDRFDGNQVMTWCRKYWEIKTGTAEALNTQRSNHLNGK
jgi:hypothetical protein